MTSPLSTTSYAVLGMFAIRPWTPYELAQQTVRSLEYCWPISERAIYNEPERLREAGFVTMEEEPGRGRSRRTYSITDAGRAALEDWLRAAPAPPRVFHEPLLKLLFADQGDLASLRASLAHFGSEIASDHAAGRARMATYLEGDGPFPERAHLIAAFSLLIDKVFVACEDWVAEMLDEIEGWPSTSGLGLTDSARAQFQRVLAAGPGTDS